MTKFEKVLRRHEAQFELHLDKVVNERVRNLLSNKDLFHIWHTYGGEIFRRSSALYGLDAFLKEILKGREEEAKTWTCLEIGTFNGLTAVVFARYFGKVVSVDILDKPIKHDVVRLCGITNVEFKIIKDNDEKRGIIERCKPQFVVMEGDHANDTQYDFNLVRHVGRVLTHEYWPAQPPVWELFNSFPPEDIRRGAFNFVYWESDKWKGESVNMPEARLYKP
jgi:hypothetical protein